MDIQDSLKRFRREFNLSQKAVADKLGIKQPSYAAYELSSDKPKSSTPSCSTAIKLAIEYGISTDYLLGLTDDPRPVNMILAEQKKQEQHYNSAPSNIEERVAAIEAEIAAIKASRYQE